MLVSLLALTSCALPLSSSARTTAIATATHTPQPTPTATLSPGEIQQQKAQAIATYTALFNNGIPSAMKGIKILANHNGNLEPLIVQIGTTFDGSPMGGYPERVVMPVYSYASLQEQPTITTTYGTMRYGKPATFDFTAPPYLETSDQGSFLLMIGGLGGFGSEYNGYLGNGGSSGVVEELGLPKNSGPATIANAKANLITKVGASMMKAAGDPQASQGKVAAYLTLPQDDPKAAQTDLYIPQAGVFNINVSDGLPNP